MARPTKIGLDYFPLDVDIDQDDKVAIIEALHGLEGFGVIIKLLMKIYKEGYFYEWTRREQLLFSKRINVDINSLNKIVNDCVNEGLFDKELFEKYNILTSKGIQNRYLEAVKRRKEVTFHKDYFLIDDVKKIVGNSSIDILLEDENGNVINVNINSNSDKDNGNNNTQSKEKKSKEKKSKDINNKCRKSEIYEEDSIYFKLANYLYQKILENNPNHRKPNLQTWANDVRLMMERDNRTEKEIRFLIDWTQQHQFWHRNILSIATLRKQFDRLILDVKAERNKVVSIQQKQQTQSMPKAYQSLQDWANEEG